MTTNVEPKSTPHAATAAWARSAGLSGSARVPIGDRDAPVLAKSLGRDPHARRGLAALRAFEIALLKEIGVLPDLSLVTMTQEEVREDLDYALLPEAGVAAARTTDVTIAGSSLIALQAALEHGSLAALQQVCAQALSPLKTLLRGLLHYHLGTSVLRTRQVMLDVQSLEPQNQSTR